MFTGTDLKFKHGQRAFSATSNLALPIKPLVKITSSKMTSSHASATISAPRIIRNNEKNITNQTLHMPLPFLAAKSRIPIPTSNVVPRSRLLAALNTCLNPNVQVMLMAAPAGAGKTTLLAQWLGHLPGDMEAGSRLMKGTTPSPVFLPINESFSHCGDRDS